jgi:hypothetical protein
LSIWKFPMDFMGPQITEVGKLVSIFSISVLKHFLMFFSSRKQDSYSIFIFSEYWNYKNSFCLLIQMKAQMPTEAQFIECNWGKSAWFKFTVVKIAFMTKGWHYSEVLQSRHAGIPFRQQDANLYVIFLFIYNIHCRIEDVC